MVSDNRGQVSLWPSAGKSALTAAFATQRAWSSASEVAAYFRINYFSIFSFVTRNRWLYYSHLLAVKQHRTKNLSVFSIVFFLYGCGF